MKKRCVVCGDVLGLLHYRAGDDSPKKYACSQKHKEEYESGRKSKDVKGNRSKSRNK